MGLKENVIIGKLIPAGTGVKDYKQLSPQFSSVMPLDEDESILEGEFHANEGEEEETEEDDTFDSDDDIGEDTDPDTDSDGGEDEVG